MHDKLRLPLAIPNLYSVEETNNDEKEEEKNERVLVLEISPKQDNTVDL